jgi:hypothetical protein
MVPSAGVWSNARDAAPVVTRCAVCEWTQAGTAAEGRAAAAKH